MSYILDALRRAEAERERERGQLPGLNAPTPGSESAYRDRSRWRLGWVGGLVAVLGVGLLLGVGLRGWLGASSVGAAKPDVAPLDETASPVPRGAPGPEVGASSRQPSTDTSWMQPQFSPGPSPHAAATAERPAADLPPPEPPVVASTPPTRPDTASPQRLPAPAVDKAPAKPTTDSPTTSASIPRANPRSTVTPVPAPPDVVPASIPDLPDEIRRQLPMMSIGGSSYSDDPASRLLIINGQVFREGDAITHDLLLERIELKSAVVKFKGARYRLNF